MARPCAQDTLKRSLAFTSHRFSVCSGRQVQAGRIRACRVASNRPFLLLFEFLVSLVNEGVGNVNDNENGLAGGNQNDYEQERYPSI
jgi:hypothetical protein